LKRELSDFLAAEIAVVDPTGAIVRVNRKWDETARVGALSPKQSGWNYIAECEAAIQRNCVVAAKVLDGLRSVLKGESHSFLANYACPFDGLHHWYQVQISSFETGGERHAILMHVDVSALQTDPLTGLSNRAMFDAQLDLALSLAGDLGRPTGVIIIDMNRLKLINDMHGHRVGDEALIALARELKKMAGPDFMVARIGGDEFGIVLPTSNDSLFTRRVIAHFGSGVACSLGGVARKPISVSACVGIAFYPEDGATASELLTSADKSMYAQKRSFSLR
jgi:diguanylate cyclase (GGDEF)-like protein